MFHPLVVGLILLLTTVGARAEVVRDWGAQINYPSRVTALQFGNAWLRVGSPIRVGAWTISVAGGGMRATWSSPGGAPPGIVIVGVTCTNPEAGSQECHFQFMPDGSHCRIPTQVRGHWQDNLITCPTAIDFAR